VTQSGRLQIPQNPRGLGTVQLYSTITCPKCGHSKRELMPTDACQFFYKCGGCGALLKPNKGDCCVYCSYGDTKCPPIQEGNACCT
jgi:hypothetical protein